MARRPATSPLYSFTARLWRWKGEAPASWVFVTLPAEVALAIRVEASAAPKAWGSVKVKAKIGKTTWSTSLFPQKETGSYLLPVKAAVRDAEGLNDDDAVDVTLDLA